MFTTLALALVTPAAQAANTLNISPSAFAHETVGDCFLYSGVTLETSGADCSAEAPILLPAGTVISTIKVYYYDNSTGCKISAYFDKASMSAFSDTVVSSSASTTSNTSVRSLSLTGTTLSSSYMYYLQIDIDYTSANSCALKGVTVTY